MKTFCIAGDITATTFKDFQEWHEKLLEESDTRACVVINSYGGGATCAMGIADIMMSSRVTFETVGAGVVYSAACMIFVAGHTRKMHKLCLFYEHSMGNEVAGSHREIQAYIDMAVKWDKMVMHVYRERTNLSDMALDAMFSTDGWSCNAEEAKAYGICHEVIR